MNSLQNVKILVVDDDKNFREILRLNMQKAGFIHIQEADNGNKALELISTLKPDLVILDIVMPDKDGIDTALEIKSKDEFKNTKFIFLTNYGEDILKEAGKEADKRIAQELGALDFFRKTDDLNFLINKIKDILKV
jgi:two-component system, OmpR family, alkaline phosphatase synthesis response regulator PhoP